VVLAEDGRGAILYTGVHTVSRMRPARRKIVAMGRSQAEVAFDLIKESVIVGRFSPGETLSENQLADFCGVSRTPIREALRKLETEGLLKNGGRSWRVSDPAPDEIYEMYETKGILESASVALAAERRTDLDLVQMRRITAAARSLPVDHPLPERIALNHEFNVAIWRAAHNKSLFELLERIGTPHVRFGGLSTISKPGQWEKAVSYNEHLTEALSVRDSGRAVELMKAQISSVRDLRIQMWQERQLDSTITA
jgi:DNA-binding GntR family transcriptional regulator